ncbi:hypothetical protein CEUSTIGMA_g317.t1 [Chlamydomonas eustigma]|uniref:Selenoprotein F n=1 Tax=Chlamydomonas eustigma TaxID=1157962 RepID=A0A250WQC0_9CHLO|nr:hypothetical protein CEUSTIGMA_g317.t1 [Chlamydomonas eustigma]|eukprot:GAX72862.1 hypothetical protein CEUSTIGMA_g317.t1 [Chlamydomonas eustigma]
MKGSFFFIFCIGSFLSLTLSEPSLECKQWGFSDPACSDCDSLATFIADEEELVDQCRQCCLRDKTVTYTQATLQVCPSRVHLWPEIDRFIDKTAQKYKGVLKVKWLPNSIPTLKLKHEGGTETLRVDGWISPQLEQFLNERVMMKVSS